MIAIGLALGFILEFGEFKEQKRNLHYFGAEYLNCVPIWQSHIQPIASNSSPFLCCFYNLRPWSIGFYQPVLLTKELQQHQPVSGIASSGLKAGFFLAQNRASVVDHTCRSVDGAWLTETVKESVNALVVRVAHLSLRISFLLFDKDKYFPVLFNSFLLRLKK